MKLEMKNGLVMPQADPFMCEVEGGWAIYATGYHGVEAFGAPDPFGPWEYKGLACKLEGHIEYWAPCMYYEDGWYYLYFSCTKAGDNEFAECLHVARSRSPFGPFEEAKQLFTCFSIDPHVVRTDAGLFLWYCLDRTDGDRVGTRVFVQRMLDPQTPAGEPVEAVSPSFDEEIFMRDRFQKGQDWHTIEGAFWLQVDGWQYVMYSGACYQNDTYHIGYSSAMSTEPDLTKVTYIKHTADGRFDPLMTRNEVEEGVGHHSVICWQGQYYAVYHARDLQPDARLTGDQRTARICKLHFQDGVITAERI